MDQTPPDPPSARPAVRAAVAIALVGVLVSLILQDNRGTAPDPASAPPAPSTSASPSAPPPAPPAPAPGPGELTVPTPPAGLEDLVCAQLTGPRALRLVSFNVHRAAGPAGSLDRVAAEIAELEPDVVLVQEVDRFQSRTGRVDQAAHLARAAGMHLSYSPTMVRGRGQYGTLVLSRHEIVQEGRYPLTGRPGLEPRAVQWVTLDVQGQPVRVYNTHLEAVRPRVRRRQAQQVASLVRRDPLPVVVGGDLNAWPGSPEVAAFSTHLVDTWRAGRGSSATNAGGRRIDYLFVSKRFRPVRTMVVPSSVSDHHRVLADVRLTAPRRCS